MKSMKRKPLPEEQIKIDAFLGAKQKVPKKKINPHLNKTNLQLIENKIRTPQHQRIKVLKSKHILPKPPSQLLIERVIVKFNKTFEEKKQKLENFKKKKVRTKKDLQTKNQDLIKKYERIFPWLEVRHLNLFFCKYCIKYCEKYSISEFSHKNDYYFIKEGANVIKKDNFVKHEVRNLHQKATLLYGTEKERKELEELLQKQNPDLRKILENM